MHLNSDGRYPDLTNLFILTDVTDEVRAVLPWVAASVGSLVRLSAL